MRTIEKHISVKGNKLWTKSIMLQPDSSKPTLIFLHDALGSVAQWKDFPMQLAKQVRLNALVYDRLGHGFSDAGRGITDFYLFEEEALVYLAELLLKMKINKTILIGHSDGGTIALLYAARYNTEAIIAESAHIIVEKITQNRVLTSAEKSREIIARLEKYHGKKAAEIYYNWFKLWPDKERAGWSIEKVLRAIKAPALIVQGKQDDFATESQARRIFNGIEAYRELYLPDDCGHTPHHEKKTELIEKIISFLQKTKKR